MTMTTDTPAQDADGNADDLAGDLTDPDVPIRFVALEDIDGGDDE